MACKQKVLTVSLVCCAITPLAQAQEAADPALARTEAESATQAEPAPAGAPAAEEVAAKSADSAAAPVESADKASSQNRLLEEVIVTAQKREENLQDVPISIQAFNADALDARGIEEPKALQFATPGMQYQSFGGFSLIYIRGVGTDAFIPCADPSVATYVDGIYYPVFQGMATALGSVERVEVLKGPQGTLFGRNTTGGAINVVTKRPGMTPETSILATRESYDKTNVRVYTNLPVAEGLAFSISGLSYSEEPYYKLGADSPRTSQGRDTVRAYQLKMGWTPIDNLETTFGYTFMNNDGPSGANLVLGAGHVTPLGYALGVRPEPKQYLDGTDSAHFVDATARVATADIKYSGSLFDLRFIGGHQSAYAPAKGDYDGSAQPLVSFDPHPGFQKTTTLELQLLSNKDSWGSDWLKYIGGVYYIKSQGGFDPILFYVAPGVLNYMASPPPGGLFSALNGATVPLINFLNQTPLTNGLAQFLNAGVTLGLSGVINTQSTAAFFQTTVNFTDELALTLGGRYQTESRDLFKSKTTLVMDPNDLSNAVTVCDFNTGYGVCAQNAFHKKDTSNFSPKVVIDYKPRDEDLAYLSYSKGFKSGTFNIVAIYSPTQYVEPEVVKSYELGYKTTLLNGSMRLNMAAFHNTIDNLQVQTISITSGGAVRFENAGSARIQGADFDALWELFPQTVPGLVLTGGGAYLDGKYTSYKNGSGYDEQSGLFFGGSGLVVGGGVLPGRDFTGNTTARTPRFTGNLGLSYSFDMGPGNVEVASDVYYNSGMYFNAQNSRTAEQDAYEVVNVRASYFYQPWGMRLTAFGKNVNRAKYYVNLTDLDFSTMSYLAPPDTYGLRLNWDF